MIAPEPQTVVGPGFTPALDFAFEIRAFLAPSLHIGHGAGGVTEYVPITGGTVDGPRLRGTVLAGGDWCDRRGGVYQLDARYLLQADDGAVIDITNRGYHHEDDPTAPARYDSALQVSEAGVYTGPPPSSAPPPPISGSPAPSSSASPAATTPKSPSASTP